MYCLFKKYITLISINTLREIMTKEELEELVKELLKDDGVNKL